MRKILQHMLDSGSEMIWLIVAATCWRHKWIRRKRKTPMKSDYSDLWHCVKFCKRCKKIHPYFKSYGDYMLKSDKA